MKRVNHVAISSFNCLALNGGHGLYVLKLKENVHILKCFEWPPAQGD